MSEERGIVLELEHKSVYQRKKNSVNQIHSNLNLNSIMESLYYGTKMQYND